MWHVLFTSLLVNAGFSEQIKITSLLQYSLVFPRGDENSYPACEKLMITQVHGTKRGGTHIYSDQTGWQTGPWGHLPPTHKELLPSYTNRCTHYTHRATASRLRQHLIWGDGNRRTQACNPVRVTPARLKRVPVAIRNWLQGIGKWICLQSHSQMNMES